MQHAMPHASAVVPVVVRQRVGGAPVEEELALLEAAAEVDVERDLGVVDVHREALVLAEPVRNHERLVVVDARAARRGQRRQRRAERPQPVREQRVEEASRETEFVKEGSVAVHRVRLADGQSGGAKVSQLLGEQPAEQLRKDRQRIDARSELRRPAQLARPRLLDEGHKVAVQPALAQRPQLGMERRVLGRDAGLARRGRRYDAAPPRRLRLQPREELVTRLER
mmetsp:Transcript_36720/g.121700  ORF Transcript_36720/g.121700 Transcript_36720/m.121700 type:complete len:225 (-) Transcript_36720:275-949(-)